MDWFPSEHSIKDIESEFDNRGWRPAPKVKPVVLITGASSGIGLALARKLWLDPDYRVVVTARRVSLSKIKNEIFTENDRFIIRPLDVTIAAERNAIINEINDKWGGVDVLINNAGVSYRSVLEHMSESELYSQLNTNFIGPIELIRLVLPLIRKKENGHIINISSVGGMMAMPTMSAYSASKFALEGATESLWYELRPWNIKVTLIQPGFINSESFKNVEMSKEAKQSEFDQRDPYNNYYKYMRKFIHWMMKSSFATPQKMADLICKIMKQRTPSLRVTATVDALIFGILRRIIPRKMYHLLLYYSLPGISHWRNR